MGIGVVILFYTVVLTITALIAPLTKGRKDHFHHTARRFLLPPPLVGTTTPTSRVFGTPPIGSLGKKSTKPSWRAKNVTLISGGAIMPTASRNGPGMVDNASCGVSHLSMAPDSGMGTVSETVACFPLFTRRFSKWSKTLLSRCYP